MKTDSVSTDERVEPARTGEHTPGPWEAVQSPLEGADVRLKRRHWQIGSKDTRKGVALAFGDNGANAALIAAAPDLLALAKRYAAECRECEGSGESSHVASDGTQYSSPTPGCADCADIRQVINRAEGRV